MHIILEDLNRRLELITEDAGRGRGVQVFKGIKDLYKKASTTARVDYGNRPPKTSKFNLMNYYTLDVRLKEENIVSKFQSNLNIFTNQILKAVNDVAIAGLGADENLERFRIILREAYSKDEIAFGESKDKFDNTINQLLCEIIEQPDATQPQAQPPVEVDQNAEKIKTAIRKGILKTGKILTYIDKDGAKVKAKIMALPNDVFKDTTFQKDKRPQAKMFTVQPTDVVIQRGKERPIPVRIFKQDGSPAFEEIGAVPSYDPNWDTLPLEELLNIPEIKEHTDGVAFIIGKKENATPSACILRPDVLAQTIVNSLISAFRGKVKQGVTLEEILTGKFTQKVINPEKGAFINKVKDPTSRQPLDFRAWNDKDLEMFHNIISYAFITSKEIPKDLQGAVLYMTEEDFDKFIKGGEGFQKLAAGIGSELAGAVKVLNI